MNFLEKIILYPDEQTVKSAIEIDDPLLVLVSHDNKSMIVSNIDDAGEHIILLRLAGFIDTEIDKYYRLVVNKSGADWTFVCPPEYGGISDKSRRIQQFYNDGFDIIPHALKEIGYDVPLEIPRRYRRHMDLAWDK
ncbi:MAG: hypothetical protein RSA27_02230 [Oscillospiraceae bacterium]